MKYRGKVAINSHGQKGAALLAFMLIMITGASFMLISKMNKERIDRENITETYRALERAKQALIGFALTTPERSAASARPGPGYLPCPDTDNDGDANTPCGAGSIGRLPYETLEEERLLDDSGEVLWYALADAYRFIGSPFTPLNSETTGTLGLDEDGDGLADITDIVAIIIAPGPALAQLGQDRKADFNDISNYLEKDNKDGDSTFISSLAGEVYATYDDRVRELPQFNDRVMALTRQELMSAVEKRVLGEIDRSFENYRNSYDAYPWLSPFANPAPPMPQPPNKFAGVPGTFAGHLPVHIADSDINYIDNAMTSFSIDWSALNGGATVYTGIMTDDVCLRNSVCQDSTNYIENPPISYAPNIATPIPANDVNCIWSDRNSFSCSSIAGINLGVVCWSPSNCGEVTRTYSINYSDDGSNITINAPTAALTRTRNLNVNGNFADQLTIQFSDVNNSAGGVVIGTATLTIDPADPGGTMNITGVDNHLDATGIDLNADGDFVDAGDAAPELPPWFIKNNWHHLVYIAYPLSETVPLGSVPGSNANPCTVNVDCIQLSAGGNFVRQDIRALAMIAGQDLDPAVDPRPNGDLTDYFEPNNSDPPDEVFDKQLSSNVFNDQLRVINP